MSATYGLYDGATLLSTISYFSGTDSAKKYYNFRSDSGHPAGISLAPTSAFFWMYHETDTDLYSFNYIVGEDGAAGSSGNFGTSISLTGTTGSVTLSDDSGELKLANALTQTFTGTHKISQNTDGGVITLSDDTFSINFSLVSTTITGLSTYFASPSNSNAVALTVGNPYTIRAVPIPAAIWMLGSGLAGLFALRRKMAI